MRACFLELSGVAEVEEVVVVVVVGGGFESVVVFVGGVGGEQGRDGSGRDQYECGQGER